MESSEYAARLNRYQTTVSCQEPDRVPVAPLIMYLPFHLYPTTTIQDALYDWSKAETPYLRYHQEYEPDLGYGPQIFVPTNVLEMLDCQYIRWPGRHLADPNQGFQIPDGTYMSQEEYVDFAQDPTGFMLTRVLPRHYARLKGLSQLHFDSGIYMAGLYNLGTMARPEVRDAIEAMLEAGEKMADVSRNSASCKEKLRESGFPMAIDTAGGLPFDFFNDYLRGLINTTMDMLECPDELLMALEAVTRIRVEAIRRTLKDTPGKTYAFFVHNGMTEFMSPQQFETFYWPGMKACVEAVIEMGCTPRLYTEGNYETRLDYFASFPKGKVVINFIGTDLRKAKEKLDGICCISGGVEAASLQYGTPEEVEKQVKQTLDVCAPGGGYILDCSACLDVARPENLRALFQTARTYGVY